MNITRFNLVILLPEVPDERDECAWCIVSKNKKARNSMICVLLTSFDIDSGGD